MVGISGAGLALFDENKAPEYIETVTQEWLLDIIKNYNNNPFRVLMDRAKEDQQDGVIKGILLHQGESDKGDTEWPKNVKKIYDKILNELNLNGKDVPLLACEVVTEEMYGSAWQHNAIIATLPDVIPNAHVISAEGFEPNYPDFAHFSSNSYRIFGRRYGAKYLELLPKPEEKKKSKTVIIIGVAIASLIVIDGIGTLIYCRYKKREQIDIEMNKLMK